MIPKRINYIFGLSETFCGKPFFYFNYLNILSAKKTNPSYDINVYYHYNPNNIHFDKLSTFCNLVKLDTISTTIKSTPFAFTEHMGDLMRLEMLYNSGGIYLDVDVVCIKSFDDLLNNSCVMGREYGRHEHEPTPKLIGLCNATMMGEKQNSFMSVWINEFYEDYRNDWNYNCVQMPYRLFQKHQNLVTVLPQSSFFKYSWDRDGFDAIFNRNSDVGNCYSLHLWENKNYKELVKYDNDYIISNTTTLTTIYKQLI